MILSISNRSRMRDQVVEYIRRKKLENPNFKVVDLGGSANPWCDALVDFYVDITGMDKRLIKGDLQSPETWEKIRASHPDFFICTHTLEDIRDPGWVLAMAFETIQSGFIAVPNKHQELSRGMESWKYPGWCHHRWIFSCSEAGELNAIAKFPVTICLGRGGGLSSRIFRNAFMAKLARKFRLFPFPAPLKWLDASLSKPEYELSILFEGKLSFQYINKDFAGSNIDELINLYANALAKGY